MSKKIHGFILRTVAVVLTAVFICNLSNCIPAQAAKKTVRVGTQKELNKALKNKKVGTVFLRTETYDTITISSKKAKKKNLIVAADKATIINKSRFRSITINSVERYIEDVSGNTIDHYGSVGVQSEFGIKASFEIAEGRTVKKMTLHLMPDGGWYHVIRSGAKIENLLIENRGNKGIYDKKTGVIKITTTDIEDESEIVRYEFKLDECGRIIEMTYGDDYGSSNNIKTDYDANGNPTRITGTYIIGGETYVSGSEYEYDKNNNTLSYTYFKTEGEAESGIVFEYDKNGRLIKETNEIFVEGSSYESTFSYDKKGRMVKQSYRTIVAAWDPFAWTDDIEYSKEGYKIKAVTTYTEGEQKGQKVSDVFEYDKEGNRVKHTHSGFGETYEYKYEYDEFGKLKKNYQKVDGKWVDMTNAAG